MRAFSLTSILNRLARLRSNCEEFASRRYEEKKARGEEQVETFVSGERRKV